MPLLILLENIKILAEVDFSFNKCILSLGTHSGLIKLFENLKVMFIIIHLCLLLAYCKAIKTFLFFIFIFVIKCAALLYGEQIPNVV